MTANSKAVPCIHYCNCGSALNQSHHWHPATIYIIFRDVTVFRYSEVRNSQGQQKISHLLASAEHQSPLIYPHICTTNFVRVHAYGIDVYYTCWVHIMTEPSVLVVPFTAEPHSLVPCRSSHLSTNHILSFPYFSFI